MNWIKQNYKIIAATVCIELFMGGYLYSVFISRDPSILYNRMIYTISTVMMVVTFVAIIFLYLFRWELYRVFLLVGIVFGLIITLLIPTYCVPDEQAHIFTAYNMSNMELGKKYVSNPDNTKDLYMRQDDANFKINVKPYSSEQYDSYFHLLTQKAVHTKMVKTKNKIMPMYRYQFILSSTGISIGRLLNLSFPAVIMLGRLLNFAFFIFAVSYAIKKIPFGKILLFVLALMPMTLQQAASISYDSPINSLAFLIAGLSIKLAYDKENTVKKTEWVILILSCLLFVPAKSGAYFMLALMPILIWYTRRKEAPKIAKAALLLAGACLLLFVILKIYGTLTAIPSNYPPHYVKWAHEMGYSPAYFIAHPKKAFIVIRNTLARYDFWYIDTFIGTTLGWLQITTSRFAVYMFMLAIVLAMFKKKNEQLFFNGKAKLIVKIASWISIMCIFAGMLFEWSPISQEILQGVQGRYFIPVAVFWLLSFQTETIEVKKDLDNKIVLLVICALFLIVESVLLLT